MGPGSDQADDPPAAGHKPGLADWHGDLMARLDRLGWLRGLSDRLAAVLVPVRERHQDNPVA
jgi:hypothetical protein